MGLFDGIRGIVEKFVPSRNDKILRGVTPLVDKINELEPQFEGSVSMICSLSPISFVHV